MLPIKGISNQWCAHRKLIKRNNFLRAMGNPLLFFMGIFLMIFIKALISPFVANEYNIGLKGPLRFVMFSVN